MENFLKHFKFAQFKFIIKAIEPLILPSYKGSTLRGGFGHAFKKVVCVKREKICETCLLKGRCVYSYIFETPPSQNTSKMRKYPFVPHPFIITPPLEEKKEYRAGETLCFELTLIGKSIDYLPYFIYTFDELGCIGIGKGKGKYQLEEVKAIHPDEEGKAIYSGKDKILHSHFKTIQIDNLPSFPFSPFTLQLNFVTPTRLKFGERLTPYIEFHILARNLIRRISLLSYFHCEKELDIDFRDLIEKSKEVKVKDSALKWFDWERYSSRQETKLMMGGFIGSITFEGNLKPWMPFLILGEYIHVGKGTSFGLGKYQILT